MKTKLKLACLSVAIFAFGNCTYVEPTVAEPTTTTTTTTEHVPGGSVTTEETITGYR